MRGPEIHIGLVNNMAGAGFNIAERQFCSLLNSAVPDIRVRISRFALPGISRPASYSPAEWLWDAEVDALIVTGREPRAQRLQDELYWNSLAELLEWSQINTYSVIWSCLAAHAAVLHLDGIERQPLGAKLFGVFESARQLQHPLLHGIPDSFNVPHSRWNDLSVRSLEACGYQILTRSTTAGSDIFLKRQRRSLFVFFQGHPEYDNGTLVLEYRRDVRRFLHGEQERYPSSPCGLTGKNTWRPVAVALYRNWLRYLTSRKTVQDVESPVFMPAQADVLNAPRSARSMSPVTTRAPHGWPRQAPLCPELLGRSEPGR